MERNHSTHFLLGANSRYGFYSLYDRFIPTDGSVHLYIIKGGPGCGKSSFMKKIAASMNLLGFETEYIHCSGAPVSLDGVYFPQLKTAYMDGTAPHVREPQFPSVSETYLDLGQFYDTHKLQSCAGEIREINRTYKGLYGRAYALISAACGSIEGLSPPLLTDKAHKTLLSRARGIAGREFKKSGKDRGKITPRFLSALSCDGDIFYTDTAEKLCEKIYLLDNALGFSPKMLSLLEEYALSAGYDVISCPSHLDPKMLEHLLIPELSLGFLSGSTARDLSTKPFRHIRLDALADSEMLKQSRSHRKPGMRLHGSLLEEARSYLSEAGALHDKLEAIYNPHVDFDGVYGLASRHVEMLVGK